MSGVQRMPFPEDRGPWSARQESSDETDHVASLPTEQGQERREEASFHARRQWQEDEEGVELEWMEWAKERR